ncbi:MAG: CRISPR-associated endonuclease Cas1 [Fusobacterium sp.]|uniref:CRISPR-associated endonuclease Cas1 n=1 Tax=Fusobacterium sp. TaxID=68766 RepID=UPI002A753F30|nr:CRISPR-associated endonuclease Cas1 [Fusobacterium sp.]MDY3059664.1 CRISPR-associated endonuclease Cas1 [Fusobacterium sp.]
MLANGFDPTIGIIHVEGNEKLPFLYDLIEKYRYLAFRSVFEILNKNMISEEDFENNILSFDGRKVISSYFNEKLKENINYKNKKYTVEKAIELDLRDIKKMILDE